MSLTETPSCLLSPADLSNENPYEDIELESQCSQQSLPSSPGADSTKVAAEATRRRAFIHTPLEPECKKWSLFRLQGLAFSDRIQPGASNCWIYAGATSRPTAPAAEASPPPLSSARRPHPPGWTTLPGRRCVLTAVAAPGYQRCVFQKLKTFNQA